MPLENLIKEQKKAGNGKGKADTTRELEIVVHKCRLNILGKCPSP